MRVYVRTLPFATTQEDITVALRALDLPVPSNIHIIRKGTLPNLVLVHLCFWAGVSSRKAKLSQVLCLGCDLAAQDMRLRARGARASSPMQTTATPTLLSRWCTPLQCGHLGISLAYLPYNVDDVRYRGERGRAVVVVVVLVVL